RADQHLVVGDQHPDHVRLLTAGTLAGRLAASNQPPSSSGPATSVPPSARTRSRIPARPRPEDGSRSIVLGGRLLWISTCSPSRPARTRTRALVPGPACLSTFVSPS